MPDSGGPPTPTASCRQRRSVQILLEVGSVHRNSMGWLGGVSRRRDNPYRFLAKAFPNRSFPVDAIAFEPKPKWRVSRPGIDEAAALKQGGCTFRCDSVMAKVQLLHLKLLQIRRNGVRPGIRDRILECLEDPHAYGVVQQELDDALDDRVGQ